MSIVIEEAGWASTTAFSWATKSSLICWRPVATCVALLFIPFLSFNPGQINVGSLPSAGTLFKSIWLAVWRAGVEPSDKKLAPDKWRFKSLNVAFAKMFKLFIKAEFPAIRVWRSDVE